MIDKSVLDSIASYLNTTFVEEISLVSKSRGVHGHSLVTSTQKIINFDKVAKDLTT